MAIGGQRPKPARLKLLEGNRGKRRIPREPEPSGGVEVGDCPATLNDVARKEWARLCGDMSKKGVLTSWDCAVMAAYCQSFADWLEAQGKVNSIGQVVKAARTGVPMQNPYVSIARAAKADMWRLATELGLTPVSRARMGTAEQKHESAGDVPAELADVSGG